MQIVAFIISMKHILYFVKTLLIYFDFVHTLLQNVYNL